MEVINICVNDLCVCVSTEEDEEEEEEDEEIKDRSQPRHTIWLDVETSREAAHWLPWRPDKAKGQSEEDCEDPDRQVLCFSTTLYYFTLLNLNSVLTLTVGAV